MTFTYTSDNLDSVVTNPDGGKMTVKRDTVGNVIEIINPGNHVTFRYLNRIGQDTMVATPLDAANASSYSPSYYRPRIKLVRSDRYRSRR